MPTFENEQDFLDYMDCHYEGTILFSNPSYWQAYCGTFTDENDKVIACYNHEKIIEELIENHEMTEEDALDYVSYNCSFGCGGYPRVLYT